jgi:uncharacterized protein YunC (DUF1805 family)
MFEIVMGIDDFRIQLVKYCNCRIDLNFKTASKVKGVQNFEDMLKAQVVESTQLARKLGIEPGMTGREALERMF